MQFNQVGERKIPNGGGGVGRTCGWDTQHQQPHGGGCCLCFGVVLAVMATQLVNHPTKHHLHYMDGEIFGGLWLSNFYTMLCTVCTMLMAVSIDGSLNLHPARR